MKKLYLGFVFMITGAMIIAGALIGGGATASGMNTIAPYYDIFSSAAASQFVMIGSVLFIIGLVISIVEAYKKEKQ